jgi:hypothetical protein
MTHAAPRDSARLRAAGYLAGAGGAHLEGAASLLLEAWRDLLRRTLASSGDTEMQTPLFIDRVALRRSRYATHFPQQLFAAGNAGSSRTPRPLTPAACLHVYPMFRGRSLGTRTRRVFVEGPVARFEAGAWRFPFRLASFRMAELVVIGSAASVERAGTALEEQMAATFHELGLEGGWRPATDPFFGPRGRGARVLQAMRGGKHEYWPADPAVAVASLNRHADTFGTAFDIGAARRTAHSLCLAFGLERLTAAVLLRRGPRPDDWPAQLRR